MSLLVALGGAGNAQKITTSPDGTTWTAQGQGGITLSNGPRDVCWSSDLGLFVAVASNSTTSVWTSPDGLTWTSRTAPFAPWGVSWSASLGLFVIVGDALGIASSPDGVTWTQRLGPGGANFRFQAVHWSAAAGLFMAVGTDTTGNLEPCYTSPDGITWTSKAVPIDPPGVPVPRPVEDVTYAPSLGKWVAVGGSGDVGVSTDDGTTWTQYDSAVTGNLFGVDWSPDLGLFVLVGVSTIQSSSDGQTWTSRSTAMSGTGIEWVDDLGMFVAVGASGAIYTSTDGTSWTSQTSGHSQPIECVAWGGSRGRGLVVGFLSLN